jgi:hypothetical protein
MNIHQAARRSVLASCLFVAGCTGIVTPSDIPHLDAPVAIVPLEPGDFRSVTWLDQGRVVVGYEPNPDRPRGALWEINPDAPHLTEIELPEARECRLVRYQSPQRLPDGRLGLARVCDPPQGDSPDYSQFSVALIGIERPTGVATELLTMNTNPGVIAWTSNQRRAVAGVGSFICQGIISVDADGERPIPVDISDGPQHFRLDEEPTRGTRDCDFTGRADFPAYSHHGDQLAFLASPASVGYQGQERLSRPWNIYVLPTDGPPQTIFKDISDPRGLTWTPDDRWIIFSGVVRSFGSGTWAVRVSTGRLVQVSSQAVDWLDVSPNGGRLIGTASSDPTAEKVLNTLVLMDLSPLGSEH